MRPARLGLNSHCAVAGYVTLGELLHLLLPWFPPLSQGANGISFPVAGRVGRVEMTRVKHLAKHLQHNRLLVFLSLALAAFENFLKSFHAVGGLVVSAVTL